MSDLVALLKALPAILALIKAIQKAIDDAKVNQTVSDHAAVITKAYNDKDASALNALFNK